MCNRMNLPLERRNIAINELDEFFKGISSSRRLPDKALEVERDRQFIAGWHAKRSVLDGVEFSLHVLLDQDYPYSPPQIFVVDGPKALEWPHLDRNGKLCITPQNTAVDVDDPVGVVKCLLKDVDRLIEESVTLANAEDFRDEFLSYWDIAMYDEGDRRSPITSILEPRGPSRCICFWSNDSIKVAGETAEGIRIWLNHRGLKFKDGKFKKCLLTWLPEPLLPSEYPRHGSDLTRMVRTVPRDAMAALTKGWKPLPTEFITILGMQSRNGACFAGCFVQSPKDTKSIVNGFRRGRVEPSVLLHRYTVGSKAVAKAQVRRADHSWVHGRDHDHRQTKLRGARVALIGCGSVGGQLARLVAQAGVGHLMLVDPQKLQWSNTGRHCLGARAVDRSKARALASEIKSSFPQMGTVLYKPEAVGPGAEGLMKELVSWDLIVSTTGSWTAECFLNDWQQTTVNAPAILYGWVEAYALAAHSVLIAPTGPCLSCGLDSTGRAELQVIDWPEVTNQEPACDAAYSPYGPAELAFAHALLAETVIDALVRQTSVSSHRIWIGSPRRIEDLEGQFTAKFVQEFGDLSDGNRTLESSWTRSAQCPVCGRE